MSNARAFAALVLLASVVCACTPALTFKSPAMVSEGRPERELRMARGSVGDEAFRAVPPPPSRVPKRVLPAPTEARLSNGIRVVMLERHDFPSTSAVLVLERGPRAAAPGVAALYASSLDGDSSEYSATEAWQYLTFVGGSVRTVSSHDAVTLEVTALSPLFVSALSRAAPMFASPLLTRADLEDSRTYAAAVREAEREDPAKAAQALLWKRLFPAAHPYGAPTYAPSTDHNDNDAVRAFRDRHLSADNVSVVCAGDLAPAVVLRALERGLGKLPVRNNPPLPELPGPHVGGPSIYVVDRPGASQSRVAVGWPGARSADPDALALEVLASASGSDLSSRLNVMVRKELGATYGVHMTSSTLRDAGIIQIETALETTRTVASLRALFTELEHLRTEPLLGDELAAAKVRAHHGLEGGTNQGLARLLATALAEGRPLDQVVMHDARIEAITADEVRAAAARWLVPQAARVVIVGDASRVVEDLRAMGIGEVSVISAR